MYLKTVNEKKKTTSLSWIVLLIGIENIVNTTDLKKNILAFTCHTDVKDIENMLSIEQRCSQFIQIHGELRKCK